LRVQATRTAESTTLTASTITRVAVAIPDRTSVSVCAAFQDRLSAPARPPCGEKKLALGRDIAWRDGEGGVHARLPDHRRRDIDPGHGHAAARAKFHAPLRRAYSHRFDCQIRAWRVLDKKRFDERGR
jgi:hypothetical protein